MTTEPKTPKAPRAAGLTSRRAMIGAHVAAPAIQRPAQAKGVVLMSLKSFAPAALAASLAFVQPASASKLLNADGTRITAKAAQTAALRAWIICRGEVSAADNSAGGIVTKDFDPFSEIINSYHRQQNNDNVMTGCLMRYGYKLDQSAQ